MIRQAYRAFASRDLEALRALAAEDVEIVTITGVVSGREGPYRGFEGLEAYLRDVAENWEELELIPAEFHDQEDEGVLVFGRARARRGSTIIDSPTAWLWRLRGERVTSVHVFGDAESANALLEARD